MKKQTYELGGEVLTVNVVETEQDGYEFLRWAQAEMYRGTLGFDTETSGLGTYTGDTLRTAQFGNATTGWYIPMEPQRPPIRDNSHFFRGIVTAVLGEAPAIVMHNASFDIQVVQKHLGITAESLWPRTIDTRLISHIVDPRGQADDWIIENKGTPNEYRRPRPGKPFGHRLETLLVKYINKEASDEVKALMAKLARQHRTTKANIFKVIPLDDTDYELYSGLDPVWNVRLLSVLTPLVPTVSQHLIRYEHELAQVGAKMEEQGFLVDRTYSKALAAKFREEEQEAKFHAEAFFDVESVNSPAQLVEAFSEQFGIHTEKDCIKWNPLNSWAPECEGPHFGTTPKGNPSVDKDLLEALAGDHNEEAEIGSVKHLAEAVIEAKRKSKWRTSWVDKFIDNADPEGRVHPNINTLQARTARWSITGIPTQTLPSGDWVVRRCFLADPGHRIVSVDYDAQELRVLAALSQDPVMMKAFENNENLHQITADAANVPYKVGKMANFLVVFGGGAGKLAVQAGIEFELAQTVLKSFNDTYRGVSEYKKYLQRYAEEHGHVVTPIGRVVPIDEERTYAALNGVVQSTAREITSQGVLRLSKAGFTPFMRLTIHDENLFSFPEEHAQWMADAAAELMATEFRGVNISASPEIGGRSWGSLYSCQISPECGLPKHKPEQPCEPSEWAVWKDLVNA